ncbi:MAG TPA: LysR substrate-binding domain-containing protein, partial [Paraburkholderia sp.]|nr:LysR substrate-binding domain-containing protein [Paraburkholderia sp.]
RETVAPVAHPSIAADGSGLGSSEDLAGQVLLEFDDPGRPWLHWDDWLAAAGWRGAKAKGVLRFNQYDQVVQSAMAGQGIALGRMELIRPMLADRRLVLLPTSLQGPGGDHAYWLLQADLAPRPDVLAVIEWITTEAREMR